MDLGFQINNIPLRCDKVRSECKNDREQR